MIAYVKGKVIDEFDGGVVLENNGIGYEIFCSAAAAARLSSQKEGGVYTYFQVKDDGVCLYGFDSKAEKNMFMKLIGVSGVGPKLGITVLSGISLNDLASAIATSDVKSLSRVKGLGKKTAERIILELREKVSSEGEDALLSGGAAISLDRDGEDSVIALMGLGFSSSDSRDAVKRAVADGAKSVEDIISYALKNMRG